MTKDRSLALQIKQDLPGEIYDRGAEAVSNLKERLSIMTPSKVSTPLEEFVGKVRSFDYKNARLQAVDKITHAAAIAAVAGTKAHEAFQASLPFMAQTSYNLHKGLKWTTIYLCDLSNKPILVKNGGGRWHNPLTGKFATKEEIQEMSSK